MNYVICTSGRARSSVLMKYLKQLGAGFPEEWTNSWFAKRRNIKDYKALVKYIQSRDVDGHTALRITWVGLLRLCTIHNIKAKPFFDDCLPDAKFIYFTRDELAQVTESIYYQVTAEFSDSVDTSKIVPSGQIDEHLTELATQATCWELFFQRNEITPHRVKAEDLFIDAEGTCKQVLEFLEIPYNGQELEKRNRDLQTNHEEVEHWYNQTIQRFLDAI